MLAVNYSTIRSKLKDYCDKATDNNETVIVTRKDEKNVVLMSLEHYNELMRALLDKVGIKAYNVKVEFYKEKGRKEAK